MTKVEACSNCESIEEHKVVNDKLECQCCGRKELDSTTDTVNTTQSMESSMGWACSQCKERFLIGWRHIPSTRQYCTSCKEHSEIPIEDFKEVIW